MTSKLSTLVRFIATLLVIGSSSLFAAERGALVREAIIYLSPDTASAKLGNVERGRELIVLDASRGWLHVEALFGEEKTISGWIQEKGVVRSATPQGDVILYGEAVNSEDEGSRRHGRKGAADDARRLYYRVYDYFPNSPIAGEALYRAADIQWQIERADVLSRPSAREQEHYLREGIDEQWMKLVMKKYPGTKWADLAAFHLIDNKLCGDWQGASKCPDKESEQYEKYVKEHPPYTTRYTGGPRWSRSTKLRNSRRNPRNRRAARLPWRNSWCRSIRRVIGRRGDKHCYFCCSRGCRRTGTRSTRKSKRSGRDGHSDSHQNAGAVRLEFRQHAVH